MNRWLRHELDLLSERYPEGSQEELCRLLPRHSAKSIYCKASYLGLKKSTKYIVKTRRKGTQEYMDRTSKKPLVQAFRSAGRKLAINDHIGALDAIERGLSSY